MTPSPSPRVEVVDPGLTRELRRSVLRPDQAISDPLPGDDEPAAVFFGVRDADGAVIGTCYVVDEIDPARPDARPAWHLRQMAVRPDQQGRGIGSAVLSGAADHARAAGGRRLWCYARSSAADFYARHGLTPSGPEFIERVTGLPHLPMGVNL